MIETIGIYFITASVVGLPIVTLSVAFPEVDGKRKFYKDGFMCWLASLWVYLLFMSGICAGAGK